MGIDGRMRRWIDQQRQLAGRPPRRYATIDETLARMQEENRHLSPDRARHLTLYGVDQNEDGSSSWKFDQYLCPIPAVDVSPDAIGNPIVRCTSPVLLYFVPDRRSH